jgi:N-acetyl-D-muramate 6-phosphate phosphatase
MIKGIIFDFDGTLFQTEHLGVKIIQEICEEKGIDFPAKKWTSLIGVNREDRIRKFFPEESDEIIKSYNEKYDKIFFERIHEIGDSEKAIPLLAEKYKLFIFSVKYVYLIKKALEIKKLDKYFEEIVGYESFENKKPSKDGIEHILSKHGFEKNEIVLVGDSILDKDASKNAGISFVLFKNPTEKQEFSSDYSIKSHLDLVELLNKI